MDNLTKKEIIGLLLEWEKICLKQDGLDDILISIGMQSEGLLSDCLYESNNKYTEFLAEKIGADDFLDWYRWENDMGKKQFTASSSSKSRMKKIKNIDDLADIIIQLRNTK